ncbi:hypothetical protein U9M48_010391, partial [Paspalum notatum var. saurae]
RQQARASSLSRAPCLPRAPSKWESSRSLRRRYRTPPHPPQVARAIVPLPCAQPTNPRLTTRRRTQRPPTRPCRRRRLIVPTRRRLARAPQRRPLPCPAPLPYRPAAPFVRRVPITNIALCRSSQRRPPRPTHRAPHDVCLSSPLPHLHFTALPPHSSRSSPTLLSASLPFCAATPPSAFHVLTKIACRRLQKELTMAAQHPAASNAYHDCCPGMSCAHLLYVSAYIALRRTLGTASMLARHTTYRLTFLNTSHGLMEAPQDNKQAK